MRLIFFALTLFLIWQGPAIAQNVVTLQNSELIYNPSRNGLLTIQNNDVLLEVNKGLMSSSVLRIKERNGGELLIDLSQFTMRQVELLEFIDSNRAVVFGKAGPHVDEVLIIDINSAKVEDVFWGYNVSLSPDKRFIAFLRFYHPHGEVTFGGCYAVYDLKDTPKANRVSAQAKQLMDEMDVGKIFYPNDAKQMESDTCILNNENGMPHRPLENGFYWEQDKLVFIDQFNQSVNLVSVDTASLSLSQKTLLKTVELNAHKQLCDENCYGVKAKLAFFPGAKVSIELETQYTKQARSSALHDL